MNRIKKKFHKINNYSNQVIHQIQAKKIEKEIKMINTKC